ncbi:DUF4258 domain-containing protein [Thiorhodococcus mannitoliphagus]|uniref:DUF4258 domain-containing protein n=2 Tax=Thiorhodococcus TaxID=57488 RepID=A0A6M0JYR8_9GAMM|nr:MULTISPECIES: DUF4258 domain-containing protein [Thiorhodococcus]NEV62319.1 DUF4258 domain-containing protein [Thiorhodococcus minor]NEX21208.1 DUF4258 domain-containing protein [Thiorhodococcus mannitoliphagus]
MHNPAQNDASPDQATPFVLTDHASLRMSQRGIRRDQLAAVLRFGRCRHTRGARYFFVGRKEIRRYAGQGLDLRPLENLQVLMAPRSDAVITVYRNARPPRN